MRRQAPNASRWADPLPARKKVSMKMVYDEVCPMCRMVLFHGEEEHCFYGGSAILDCEVCPTKDAPDLWESSASDNESKPAPKRVI